MRILAAVQAHPRDTVVVVVGWMHKDDIEAILRGAPNLRIVQPSAYLLPAPTQADSLLHQADVAAILAFNLLGAQSLTGPVDWPWLKSMLDRFVRAAPQSSEAELFRTRFAVLHEALPPREAAERYERIARRPGIDDSFTFRAATDERRIDTYFDPFGNLDVLARAWVEAARECTRAGAPDRATAIREQLLTSRRWSPLQLAELGTYWDRYIGAR